MERNEMTALRYSPAALALLASALCVAAPAAARTPVLDASAAVGNAALKPITEAEVLAAQKAWGDALVMIATEHDRKGKAAAKQAAERVLDSAYGYNLGPVLFKPTLAAAPQTFRTTRDGALAYFVGGNPAYPGDSGFALKGWRSHAVENAAIYLNGTTAMSMGNVRLTDAKGNVTTVDKTWGYARDKDGKLRIVLHHSSLPYAAD